MRIIYKASKGKCFREIGTENFYKMIISDKSIEGLFDEVDWFDGIKLTNLTKKLD